MKAFAECINCKNEMSLLTYSTNRVELAMKEGEVIQLTCSECKTPNNIDVDDFYAKKSSISNGIGLMIAIIGTPVIAFFVVPILLETANPYVMYVVGFMLLIPSIIYGLLMKQDRGRVSDFNRNSLKGRVHQIGR